MKQFHVLQDKNFALGNFINCTPAIQRLAVISNKPVLVEFETDYVRECFLDCPFIEHGQVNRENLAISSNMRNKIIPDYEYIYQQAIGEPWEIRRYHTYVDHDFPHPGFKPYAVFLNGTGNESQQYVSLKDPGVKPYNFALKCLYEKGIEIFFTGSMHDRIRNQRLSTKVLYATNQGIRRSLQLIRHAELVISNDTGLAHAAGAMNKPLLILWKDTLLVKNKNPGKNTVYSTNGCWQQDIKSFIMSF